jgi:hypothetical protein
MRLEFAVGAKHETPFPGLIDRIDECIAPLIGPEYQLIVRDKTEIAESEFEKMSGGGTCYGNRIRTHVMTAAVVRPVGVKIDNRDIAEYALVDLSRNSATLCYHTDWTPKIKLPGDIHLMKRPLNDLHMPTAFIGVP